MLPWPWHRRQFALLAIGVAAVGLWGCGGGSDEPAASPTTDVRASRSTPTTTAAAPDSSLTMSGDAETNESCGLAEVAEIEAQVNAGVVGMRGLTGPGAFGKTMLSCTWYLDSTEIGIPSVSVQWESPVESWHDRVVELYRSLVDQGTSTLVEGIGELAVLQGMTAETIDGMHIVRVSVLMHVEATPADQENATELLELMLSRAKT